MTEQTIHIQPKMYDKRLASSIAMTMLLVTLAMLFASLFLSFAVYRQGQESWPPMGLPRPHWGLPLLSTSIIVFSSWTYTKMQKAHSWRPWWSATFALALGFLVSQACLWSSMRGLGLYTHSGIFASLIYAFTWIHAAHILAGLFTLVWVRPALKSGSEARVTEIGKFWHFLSIVWILIYLALFVF